jgi:hypothetical protein
MLKRISGKDGVKVWTGLNWRVIWPNNDKVKDEMGGACSTHWVRWECM